MIVLQGVNITKSYGVDTIFSNIKLEVKRGERVALVGRNGAGKSTLLKILSGQMAQDEGDVIIPKEMTIGYLDQHTGLDSNRTIYEEMLTVFDHLRQMEKMLRQLEHDMSDPRLLEDNSRYHKTLQEYDELQISFKDAGGYQYEADIRSVLSGLQFGHLLETPIHTLSGGQKTRLALGKLLLTKPDLLILDEPTNHLDIETLTWLEAYLMNYEGAMIIVSHDQYFLDKIVNKVYELSRGQMTLFHGNYSHYLEEKAARYVQEKKTYEKQQAELVKLEDFIQRNIARASTSKRAQSRRKQLERMNVVEKPVGDEQSAKFSFRQEQQSGNEVLIAKDVTFAYDKHPPLFTNINLRITRGERIALIGSNGVGKSTLLHLPVGKLLPQAGQVMLGSKVTVGYYDQEQAELSSHKDVLHELWDEYPMVLEKDIRTVLGNFLFSGDDVLKPVSTLSGGEKARLALAKLMMKKANFLVFDEPTNHLDLDSKEVLEAALIDFPGALLFVSHDRFFLNRMATRTIELKDGNAHEYLGNYDYYVEKIEEERKRQELKKSNESESMQTTTKNDGKTSFEREKEAKRAERKRQRQLEHLEARINELEHEKKQLEEEMFHPDVYEDHEKAFRLQKKIEDLDETIISTMEEWEKLQP